MTVKLPRDIEELVEARFATGEYATPEQVLREALAPWIAREVERLHQIEQIRAKIAEADADPTTFSDDEVKRRLDRLAADLSAASAE